MGPQGDRLERARGEDQRDQVLPAADVHRWPCRQGGAEGDKAGGLRASHGHRRTLIRRVHGRCGRWRPELRGRAEVGEDPRRGHAEGHRARPPDHVLRGRPRPDQDRQAVRGGEEVRKRGGRQAGQASGRRVQGCQPPLPLGLHLRRHEAGCGEALRAGHESQGTAGPRHQGGRSLPHEAHGSSAGRAFKGPGRDGGQDAATHLRDLFQRHWQEGACWCRPGHFHRADEDAAHHRGLVGADDQGYDHGWRQGLLRVRPSEADQVHDQAHRRRRLQEDGEHLRVSIQAGACAAGRPARWPVPGAGLLI
mmetsp:Transcript_67810/g.153352  ORF Transcript_67810/g.153352 Transcript_67810/m.153352 type:complete len:307 (+) Transcript_67810:151-1071(+)